MMQGTYYKEWSRVLGREMEFKVYGTAGVPVLALPARGGRFYDWENNGMPDAVASLLNTGKVQLFTADSIDAECLRTGDVSPRRRAELQEKYFCYLTGELAARIRELNGDADAPLWCVGVDTGAVQAVNCRLRRPEVFAGAIGLSGLYDVCRFLGSAEDDLVLRNAPLAYLPKGSWTPRPLPRPRRTICSSAPGRALRGGRTGRHPRPRRRAGRRQHPRPLRDLGQRCFPRLVLVGQGAEYLRRARLRPRSGENTCLNSSSVPAAMISAAIPPKSCSLPSARRASAAPSWPTPRPLRA